MTRLVVSGTDITVLKAAERKLQMQAEVLATCCRCGHRRRRIVPGGVCESCSRADLSVQSKTCLGQPLEEITGLEFCSS